MFFRLFLKSKVNKISGKLDLNPHSIIELITLCLVDSKFMFMSPVIFNSYMEEIFLKDH